MPPHPAHAHALPPPVVLTGGPLSPAEVESVARGLAPVRIAPAALANLERSRRALEAAMADGEPHYGVNTGFGSFARRRIPQHDLQTLQRNLIRSHAAGAGDPLRAETVRGMMLLLAASLCRGCSAVRPVVVERIVAMLNAGVTPVVPETGSVGASGDLAPLAHTALVLIGEGEAWVGDAAGARGTESRPAAMPGAAALARAGIGPVVLEAKEGLALINGTHLMAAEAALALRDTDRVFASALTAAAMSIDACRASDSYLDARVHAARNQPGQAHVAARLRALLDGSGIIPSHRLDDPRVQDPYSFRCMPQVLGAAWSLLEYVRGQVEAELGAVTDNPLVFGGGDDASGPPVIVSAGNFHGMPVALPLDALALVLAHVAGISERRTFYTLSALDPDSGLPPYLATVPGLDSGMMIAQYTAAACCNELIGLAGPATVANISTSAGMEDYNSFGPRSAAKARRGVRLARSVVAIEFLCAAEALEHHRPLRSGRAVEAAHAVIRSAVPRLTGDRPPAPDIRAIEGLIASGALGDGRYQHAGTDLSSPPPADR